MREFVFSMLRCPQCGSTLRMASEEGRVYCNNEKKACTIGRGFPLIGELPALVVFERSVLSEAWLLQAAGSSPVHRQGPAGLARKALRRLLEALWGANRVAGPNSKKFLGEMRKISQPVALNVGCGAVGLETLDKGGGNGVVRSLGFDIYASPNADFIADAHDIPLSDASVDGVWIQGVLEHVIQPERVVAEIHRVLKPGGLIYAEVPFMQTVHEGAYDFTRYTDTGVRWLFRWFDRIDSGTVQGPGSALLWSITATMAGLFRSQKAGKLVATPLFFWVRFLDRLIPAAFSIDAACGIYFLGRKAAAPISPKDAIHGFQGVPA